MTYHVLSTLLLQTGRRLSFHNIIFHSEFQTAVRVQKCSKSEDKALLVCGMKAYMGSWVIKLHVSATLPWVRCLTTHSVGGWVGRIAFRDVLERKKILTLSGIKSRIFQLTGTITILTELSHSLEIHCNYWYCESCSCPIMFLLSLIFLSRKGMLIWSFSACECLHVLQCAHAYLHVYVPSYIPSSNLLISCWINVKGKIVPVNAMKECGGVVV